MARTRVSTPQLRAVYALYESRKHRHHKHCFCRAFGDFYCNPADALWQNKLNRELESITR